MCLLLLFSSRMAWHRDPQDKVSHRLLHRAVDLHKTVWNCNRRKGQDTCHPISTYRACASGLPLLFPWLSGSGFPVRMCLYLNATLRRSGYGYLRVTSWLTFLKNDISTVLLNLSHFLASAFHQGTTCVPKLLFLSRTARAQTWGRGVVLGPVAQINHAQGVNRSKLSYYCRFVGTIAQVDEIRQLLAIVVTLLNH